MRRRTALLLLALLLASPAGLVVAGAAAPTPLAKGDRIVFLGDSITQAGAAPKGYVTLVRNTINQECKDLAVAVLNAGISGNKVPDLQKRLERDVLARKPTIVVIYIGINDVWHWRKDGAGNLVGGTTREKFEEGLKDIIARIKAAGARVILCTPSVIGEKTDGTNERDKMLDEYADISRRVAAETGSQLNDLRAAFIAHLKANNPQNQPKGILTGDRVHLNPQGNKFVARLMLRALGIQAEPVETPPPPPEDETEDEEPPDDKG